jgi:eukaryotic-like serine/threonine-protein kinase
MGEVYEVQDRERGMRLALKRLSRAEPVQIQLFKQEFRSLADIVDDRLVRMHELEFDGKHWFFTMELVEGCPFAQSVGLLREETSPKTVSDATGSDAGLDDTIASESTSDSSEIVGLTLDYDRLRGLFKQLCLAVLSLHSRERVHRDLKPSNVLVCSDGRVVLLDFGLVSGGSPSAEALPAGRVSGTVRYMSPEQARGESVGAESDWYSVGVMLFEALAGELPINGTASEILHLKQREHPRLEEHLRRLLPADLVGLCESLLHPEVEQRAGASEVLAVLGAGTGPGAGAGRVDVAPVGREMHLDKLENAFHRSIELGPVVVRLHGESGMGKSVVIDAFLDSVEGQALVLRGQCYQQEFVPYKAVDPLVDALAINLERRPYQEVVALLPRHIKTLSGVFPVLDRVDAIANSPVRGPNTTDPHEVRRIAAAAFRSLLSRLSDRVPVVVVIDDLQWGDLDSVFMLTELLRPPSAPPLLLVLSYRSEEVGQGNLVLHALQPESFDAEPKESFVVEVGPLGLEEAAEAAELRLGPAFPHLPYWCNFIAKESGGVPVFIELLSGYILATKETQGAAENDGQISLEQCLLTVMRDLTDEGRTLLELICVSGCPLPTEVLTDLVQPADVAYSALGKLRSLRLVRTTRQIGRPLVEAYHDRIREAVSAQLRPGRRHELHESLANGLSARGHRQPEVLFIHLAGAGKTEEAILCARRAAERAAKTLAFDSAAEWYRKALTLASDAIEVTSLLNERADALAVAGRGLEAADTYLEAAKRSPEEAARLESLAARQLLTTGAIKGGRETIRTVLGRLGLALPRPGIVGMLQYLGSRMTVRMVRLTQLRPATAPDLKDIEEWELLWSLSASLALSDPIAGVRVQARQLLRASRVGGASQLARALSMEAGFRAVFRIGSAERMESIFGHALQLAAESDDPLALGTYHLSRAIGYCQESRWRSSVDSAKESVRILDATGGHWWERVSAKAYWLFGLAYMGRLRELVDLSEPMARDAAERGDLYAEMYARVSAPFTYDLVAGETAGTFKEVESLLDRWEHDQYGLQHFWCLRAKIHAHLSLAQPTAALQAIEEDWPKYRASANRFVPLMRVEAHDLRARVQLAVAASHGTQPTDAEDVVRRDVRKLKREKGAWPRAQARLLEAQLAELRDDVPAAQRQYRETMTEFEQLEMRLHVHCIGLHLSGLQGGDSAQRLRQDAEVYFAKERVATPRAILRVVLPVVLKSELF